MIAAIVLALVVVSGDVYCRSLPLQPLSSDMNGEPFSGISAPIRKTRQSDYIFHPYYPDTGSNPSLYPQQQARKQSSSQTSSVNKFIPVISAKK